MSGKKISGHSFPPQSTPPPSNFLPTPPLTLRLQAYISRSTSRGVLDRATLPLALCLIAYAFARTSLLMRAYLQNH